MTYEWNFLLTAYNQKQEEEFLPFPSNLTLLYLLFQNLEELLILFSAILICVY